VRTLFIAIIVALGVSVFAGCESANHAAYQAGQPAGEAARVPNSFMEGAAAGTAGQPSPNPYNR
jgi:hypothetical protein